MRIALVADLHVGAPHNGLDRVDAVVELTNSAGADLILTYFAREAIRLLGRGAGA